MAIKKKTDLDGEALKGLSTEDRTDLSALFDALEKNEGEISRLRKENETAHEVVKKQPQLEKLLADKETLNADLKAKLEKLTTKSPLPAAAPTVEDFLPFREIRRTIEEFFVGGP